MAFPLANSAHTMAIETLDVDGGDFDLQSLDGHVRAASDHLLNTVNTSPVVGA